MKLHWGLKCGVGAVVALAGGFWPMLSVSALSVFGGGAVFVCGCFLILSAIPEDA